MALVQGTVIPMPRRPRPEEDASRPEWAKWLVAQRESRGWLQREFATRLNISQQSLSGYERGVYRVPEDIAEKVAEVLELPYLEVRTRLGMFVSPETREEFSGEVIRLPPDVRLTPAQHRALRALIDVFLEQRADSGGNARPDVFFDDEGVERSTDGLRPAASDR
jgi:transcriptional regulator with XRE-family HTH domain